MHEAAVAAAVRRVRSSCSSGLNFFPCVGPAEKSAEQLLPRGACISPRSPTNSATPTSARSSTISSPTAATARIPLLFLTAVAQRTKNVRLITGAVLPAFNSPLKLAGEIGMLDGISGGRLEVGFARAFLPHEFAQFGVSLDESRRRFTEGLAQITMLLEAGERLLAGRVPQLQERHLAAAADADAAPAVLDRRHHDAGDLRIRRQDGLPRDGHSARARADAQPDRPLPRRLALRRPSRQRPRDEHVLHVLRADTRRSDGDRALAPATAICAGLPTRRRTGSPAPAPRTIRATTS